MFAVELKARPLSSGVRRDLNGRFIRKALLADSWGDSRIGAMLIQGGMEGSRHAISGPIARGLFG
jgi:hypothetical protein